MAAQNEGFDLEVKHFMPASKFDAKYKGAVTKPLFDAKEVKAKLKESMRMSIDLPLYQDMSSEWPTTQPKVVLPLYEPGTVGSEPSVLPLSERDAPMDDDHL